MKTFVLRKTLFIDLDSLLGILVAIPFAYPKEPLYWFGLITLMAGIARFRIRVSEMRDVVLVTLFCLIILLTNILSNYSDNTYCFSMLGTLVSMLFFLFRYCIRNYDSFITGFLCVTSLYTFFTFIVFFIQQPYQNGWLFFINSHYRMWAAGYLIEWPNVFCVFLILAAYLNWIRGRSKWVILNMTAALLTTSRMSLLALLIFAVFYLLRARGAKRMIFLLLAMLFALVLGSYLMDSMLFSRYLSERLFKSSDRLLILKSLLHTFRHNIFGIGNVPFSILNDSYESYHSSFLKVLVRYGIAGLAVFLLLVFPKKIYRNFAVKENAPIVFMLTVSVFQDMLFHIHLIIMYSVLLALRDNALQKTDASYAENSKSSVYAVSRH